MLNHRALSSDYSAKTKRNQIFTRAFYHSRLGFLEAKRSSALRTRFFRRQMFLTAELRNISGFFLSRESDLPAFFFLASMFVEVWIWWSIHNCCASQRLPPPHPHTEEASECKDVFQREQSHQRPGRALGGGGFTPTLTPNSKTSGAGTCCWIFNQETQEKPIKYSCYVAKKRKKIQYLPAVSVSRRTNEIWAARGGELGPVTREAPRQI